MERTLGELGEEIRRALKRLRAITDREQRTTLIKRIAELSINLRGQYELPDGRPDWAGKSWLYRDKLRQIYAEAGYTPDEAKNVQPIVRFHVGNIIRTRLSPEELEEYGFTAPSPHARAQTGRNERAEIVRTARALEGEQDLLRALAAMAALLERIDVARLAEMPARDRKVARGVVARAQRRVEQISEALRTPVTR